MFVCLGFVGLCGFVFKDAFLCVDATLPKSLETPAGIGLWQLNKNASAGILHLRLLPQDSVCVTYAFTTTDLHLLNATDAQNSH